MSRTTSVYREELLNAHYYVFCHLQHYLKTARADSSIKSGSTGSFQAPQVVSD